MKSFNKNVSRLSFSLTWDDKDNHLVGGLTLKAFSNSANLVFLLVFFSHRVLGEVERFFDRGQAHAPIPDDGLRLLSVHNLQRGRTLHGAT